MSLIPVQAEIRQLLADLKDVNAPRITSLTASEAQDIRKELLEKSQ